MRPRLALVGIEFFCFSKSFDFSIMTFSFPVTLVSIVLDHHHTEILLIFTIFAGPTLETKGIRAMFQKKGKKWGEIFENLDKNVQNLKIF